MALIRNLVCVFAVALIFGGFCVEESEGRIFSWLFGNRQTPSQSTEVPPEVDDPATERYNKFLESMDYEVHSVEEGNVRLINISSEGLEAANISEEAAMADAIELFELEPSAGNSSLTFVRVPGTRKNGDLLLVVEEDPSTSPLNYANFVARLSNFTAHGIAPKFATTTETSIHG